MFRCKECAGLRETIKQLERHNAYLQRLTERLLTSKGVAPRKEKNEPEIVGEAERIIQNGGEVYGE